jgi:hypothetical protein
VLKNEINIIYTTDRRFSLTLPCKTKQLGGGRLCAKTIF